MSKQDKLALISASNAYKNFIKKNDLDPLEISERVGVFFCVGILPFEDKPLEKIAETSQINGKFNNDKFSNECYNSMNPLLTFKCLPNMPLFHISYNLGITGPYLMTYPGHLDLFESFLRAIEELNDDTIDYAIVGASCDQKNILVKHHYDRCQEGLSIRSVDCSTSIILSKRIPKKGEYYLEKYSSTYKASDPMKDPRNLTLEKTTPFYGPNELFFDLASKMDKKTQNIQNVWKLGESNTEVLLKRLL